MLGHLASSAGAVLFQESLRGVAGAFLGLGRLSIGCTLRSTLSAQDNACENTTKGRWYLATISSARTRHAAVQAPVSYLEPGLGAQLAKLSCYTEDGRTPTCKSQGQKQKNSKKVEDIRPPLGSGGCSRRAARRV